MVFAGTWTLVVRKSFLKKIRIALDRRSRGCQDEKRQCRDGLRTVRTHNITNLLLSGKRTYLEADSCLEAPSEKASHARSLHSHGAGSRENSVNATQVPKPKARNPPYNGLLARKVA